MLFTPLPLAFNIWTDVSNGASYSEFDWIGIDKQDQFGVFTSAGIGYIPTTFFSSYESYLVLHQFFLNIQKSTTADIISKENGAKDYWIACAERGLFAYDCYDIHRTKKINRYDLIAAPGNPLLTGNILDLDAFDDIIPRFNLTFSGNLLFAQLRENEI